MTLFIGAVSGHENAGARQMRKMFMARAGAAAMATPPVSLLINPHHATIVALSRCTWPCVRLRLVNSIVTMRVTVTSVPTEALDPTTQYKLLVSLIAH